MNEKEKIIEEMCKNFKCCVNCEMFGGYVDDNDELKNCSCAEPTDHCTQCYISTRQAKVLYNAGYRKIPEGAVVLSKEEYARLSIFQFNTAQQIMNETRKETAKEFAEKLKEITCEMYLKEQLHRCIDKTLKELQEE